MFKFLKSLIRPSEPKVSGEAIVIGGEMAQAAEAEQKRKERRGPNDVALLPADCRIPHETLGLINPTPCDVDGIIRDICRRYADSDPVQRSATRDSISMEDFYTLMACGERAAVFGLRQCDPEIIADGLCAVAMIEKDRVDFRDILVSVALLYHSAVRIGANVDELFRRATALAEPKVAEMLNGFVAQSPGYRDLQTSWGYDEVEMEDGIGFIGRRIRTYDPTIDLKRVIIDLAKLIATDKYQPVSIEIATELPRFWLSGCDDSLLSRILGGVRGGASISTRASADVPNRDGQQFTVFLVETADESNADRLLRLSRTKRRTHFHLGVASGSLFCLIVARSCVQGVDGYETAESVLRFGDGVSEILNRYAT